MKTGNRPNWFLVTVLFVAGCSSPTQRIVPPALTASTASAKSFQHSASFTNLYVANAADVTVYAPGSREILRKISRVEPAALAFDSSGNLYVANDTGTGRVPVYPPGATAPSRTVTQLVSNPRALAVDRSDNLYVANGYFNVGVYASGSSTLLRKLRSFFPMSIAFDRADNVYVGSSSGPYGGNNSSVLVFARNSSRTLRSIANGISDPQSLALDSSGNVYVADTNLSLIAVYPKGAVKPQRRIRSGIRGPVALRVDTSGDLYVANNISSTVTVYAPGGLKPLRTIISGISRPTALLLDASGTLYVANRRMVTVYAPGSSSPKLKIRNGIESPVGLALGP